MSNQFYITLPSNSLMKLFPNNTTAHFITKIKEPIKLLGEWEMALFEINFPQTLLNVTEGCNEITNCKCNGKRQACCSDRHCLYETRLL